jgi:phosphatidate phosphatase PAH1
MDGTMTKSDLTGLYNNYKSKDYAHDGYYDLLRSAT